MKKPESFKLCTAGSCCPIVDVYTDKITISDDYNGKVTLTKAEAKLLAEKILEFK